MCRHHRGRVVRKSPEHLKVKATSEVSLCVSFRNIFVMLSECLVGSEVSNAVPRVDVVSWPRPFT